MSVAAVTELWRMSAAELAQAIRSKQASSREVVEAHLQRIEAIRADRDAQRRFASCLVSDPDRLNVHA